MKFFSAFVLTMSLMVVTVYGAEEVTNNIDIKTLKELGIQDAAYDEEFEKLRQKLTALQVTNQTMEENNIKTAKQVLAYDKRSITRNTKRMNKLNKKIKKIDKEMSTLSDDVDIITMEKLKQKLKNELAPLQKRNEDLTKFRKQYKKYTKKR